MDFSVIKKGSAVSYRLGPEMTCRKAEVVSSSEDEIEILVEEAEGAAAPGGMIVLLAGDENTDYYAEVMERKDNRLRLKLKWPGRRSYFRVDDLLPISYRKIDEKRCATGSRFFLVASGGTLWNADETDESISPALRAILLDIENKLGLILRRLDMAEADMHDSDARRVNISASGIRFVASDRLEIGDVIELSIKLPLSPPVGLMVCGKVVRTRPLTDDMCEVAVNFIEIGDDALDAIIRYTLKRQREIRQRQRGVKT